MLENILWGKKTQNLWDSLYLISECYLQEVQFWKNVLCSTTSKAHQYSILSSSRFLPHSMINPRMTLMNARMTLLQGKQGEV
jgi:hypothetical protein